MEKIYRLEKMYLSIQDAVFRIMAVTCLEMGRCASPCFEKNYAENCFFISSNSTEATGVNT